MSSLLSDAPGASKVAAALAARGAIVRDASGREWLDLLAGMGVANVGHGHPDVVAAVRAQAERYLHVMVYGEFVQAIETGRELDEALKYVPGVVENGLFLGIADGAIIAGPDGIVVLDRDLAD